MNINFKLEAEKHQILFKASFMKALNTLGVKTKLRVDQFSELENQIYMFYALECDVVKGASLKEIEQIFKNIEFYDQTIIYPKVMGMIPYEQASEFLPIILNNDIDEQICIIPSVLLAVHKIKPEAHLLITRTPENSTDTNDEKLKRYEKLFNNALIMALNMPSAKSNVMHESKGYDIDATVNQSKDSSAYHRMLEQTKQYIIDGEIFQAVISNRFRFDYRSSPYDFYLEALENYGMPYNCYIELDSETAYSITSPEMLVQYDATTVRTRPIAGTRPIKGDGKDDLRQKELANDAKENAEHLMLVDLGRNDLSKVSKSGTVRLNFYKEIKPYHKVYHMVSEVVGEPDFKRIFDPIRATFPAGTVSGAPKIRAMEIIRDLEGDLRKQYAGSTYMINSKDEFVSCINIRCAVFKNQKIDVQVGSGIVYDSETESENKELVNKIRGHLETMEKIGGQHVFTH